MFKNKKLSRKEQEDAILEKVFNLILDEQTQDEERDALIPLKMMLFVHSFITLCSPFNNRLCKISMLICRTKQCVRGLREQRARLSFADYCLFEEARG
ncbi:hypothetical protein [Sporolactobacillus spathodeae]|uniref:Uncharacterized protein n=1 Tax=Sporolactobacillus spathodeae TaxID=1465502 RepID=A0ABS2QB32_9BACL|nr:hypothetical protein [Sporolactobacillus spathodeae]MBM7658359.1 hypothetical protein [Sporolactobacillus spathodeae]